MPLTLIAREDWPEFCDSFTRQHAGALVTLVTRVRGQPERVEARELRLRGVTAELRADGADEISIDLGGLHRTDLTHSIRGTQRLSFVQKEQGGQEGLDIEAGDQLTTVRFRVPVWPESVDGVLKVS